MLKSKLMIAIIAMCLVIPTIMAASTLNVPVTGTNYTTITFNCSTDVAAALNATIYYNASGGATGTVLGTIDNSSAGQTDFTQAISIEALSDALTYNMSCYVENATDQEYSAGVVAVGIDNTAPSVSISELLRSSMSPGGLQTVSWTSSDATSGLTSTNLTVTSPKPEQCSAQSWTTATGTEQQVSEQTLDCTGTYTVSLSAVDNAGNTGTATSQTFTVGSVAGAGSWGIGSDTASNGGVKAVSGSVLGDAFGNIPTPVIIVIVVVIVLYFANRKK